MASNNTVMRKVDVGAAYAPLSETSLIASVEISALPGNAANVLFKGDDDSDVPWVPGEFHKFERVDLSEILVKGTVGDSVTVIGGTW